MLWYILVHVYHCPCLPFLESTIVKPLLEDTLYYGQFTWSEGNQNSCVKLCRCNTDNKGTQLWLFGVHIYTLWLVVPLLCIVINFNLLLTVHRQGKNTIKYKFTHGIHCRTCTCRLPRKSISLELMDFTTPIPCLSAS